MSDVVLTPQQRLALETKGVDVALSAGAGCGKTFVLARRLLGEIRPPAGRDLSRVTALTFTNKAARELRERVRNYCRAEFRTAADPAAREGWLRLVRELEAAPISTFHVFCKGILKRFSIPAGLDPGFGILEGVTGTRRRDQAVTTMLRDALSHRDPDLWTLALDHGLDFVSACVEALLPSQEFDEITPAVAGDAAQLAQRWADLYHTRVRPASTEKIIRRGEAVLEQLASIDCRFNAKLQERKLLLLDQLPRLGTEGPSPDRLLEIRANATIQHVTKWPEADAKESLQAVFLDLRNEIDRQKDLLGVDPSQSRDIAVLVGRIARLALKASEAYEEAKLRSGELDYNDLLIRTRSLLRTNAGEVRDALAAGLDAILIDEFQDTDPIQEEIVRTIAGRDRLGGRLYVVGDVKQSIYGFRGARPDLFTRLQAELPEAGRLPLSENFRSVPGILHFVNALFAEAFAEPYQPLISRYAGPVASDPPVLFLWGTPDPERNKPSADESRREEGRRIARFIAETIRDARPIRDRANGGLRPARASDFALLFRSMTDLAPYESALADEGLDYHVIGSLAFFARQEIVDICNILSMIEDPRDAGSVAGALRGPFLGLSDEALHILSNGGTRDLHDGLLTDSNSDRLRPDDRVAAVRARDLTAHWRKLKDRVPIAELVDRVFSESGYEPALIGEPLGDRKRANARKVVRLARSLDTAGDATFADFVKQLRADLRTPPRESEAATTDEAGDVVRLMSIHQSKGLEFPIVVLPDLDRKPAPDFSRIAIDSDVGIVINMETAEDETGASDGTVSKNVGWLVHQQLKRERERAEALRVFYVATTRARDLLVLSSGSTPDGKPASPAMELLEARFDRRTGACRAILPEGWEDPVVAVAIASFADETERRGRRKPDLLGLAKSIENAGAVFRVPTLASTPRPARPRIRRLGELLESAVTDPRFHVKATWREALRRAAGSLATPVSTSLIDELDRRWRRWVEGPYGDVIARAAEIRRPRRLTSERSLGDGFDLAYESADGWTLVAVSLVESDEAAERTRLDEASRRSDAFGPITQRYLLRLGDGGGLIPLD